MASFNATVDHYRALLASVDTGQPELPNENLDVGGPDIAGKYKGTDKAYAKLLAQLADHQFTGMPQELRENIPAYYKDLNPQVTVKSTKKEKAESEAV